MKCLKLVFSIVLIAGLAACSDDANFTASSTNDVNGSGAVGTVADVDSSDLHLTPISLQDVEALCNSKQQQSRTVYLNFPKPSYTCEWGKNGNLDKKNQYFQARIEERMNLNLPAGAVICDAQFNFVQQNFLYDDHFLLLFNKSVIASSYNFESKLNSGVNNLLNYNWSKLAGMYWDTSKEEIYCPQIPNATANCSFPGHDQQGYINLYYDPLYIKSIMANGLPENHSFAMISLGDNDSQDCEHSDVQFTVQVKYVQ